MISDLDSLAWAILAGFAMVGCGSGGITAESGETSAANTSEATSVVTTETSSGPAESETSEAEVETETGTDEETETGVEEPECEADDDCEAGSCFDGECLVCEYDTQCEIFSDEACVAGTCTEGKCSFAPKDCSINAPCHVGYCDPELQNLDNGVQGVCVIDFCDEYDGNADLELEIRTIQYEVPAALDIGAEIRVFGWEAVCLEHIYVVRELGSGELLLWSNRGPDPASLDALFAERFNGETSATLPTPLSFDIEAAGCPPDDGPCGETIRGQMTVDHVDGPPCTTLDGHPGWAHEGYWVNNFFMRLGDPACQQVQFMIGRQDCEGDCPTVTNTVECAPSVFAFDALDINWRIPTRDYETWGFDCVVVDESVASDPEDYPLQIRGLDCVPFSDPVNLYNCTSP